MSCFSAPPNLPARTVGSKGAVGRTALLGPIDSSVRSYLRGRNYCWEVYLTLLANLGLRRQRYSALLNVTYVSIGRAAFVFAPLTRDFSNAACSTTNVDTNFFSRPLLTKIILQYRRQQRLTSDRLETVEMVLFRDNRGIDWKSLPTHRREFRSVGTDLPPSASRGDTTFRRFGV